MIIKTSNISTADVGKTGIKIKKSHSGLFTEYCDGEVTQNCIDKAKNSGNPTLKKRAIFAENARSWKHEKGGQLIPKHKIGYVLDYDPKNPYHVHNNGEKIVITPEQYEKHKDEPYFANIRKQVEEHQADYPGPEYTEIPNPEYRKVYANVKARSNQHFKEHNFNGQTHREYSVVPEAYFRNSIDGVVTDEQGNLYRPMTQADIGKGVIPMFTTTERDYRNGRNFDMSWVRVKTPSKTIRTLKQPLPVDRTYDVDEDLNNSVNKYINDPIGYNMRIWSGEKDKMSGRNMDLDKEIRYYLYDELDSGKIRRDSNNFIVDKDYYNILKKEFPESKYFESKMVTPIYPLGKEILNNIQLKIN